MAIPTYTREQLITLVNQYLVPNSNILATEHNQIETAIVNAIYGQIGDIKEIACDINYINANFKTGTSLIDEGLGLSNGERYGWAICNGKNGTINKMGRVAIGYDPVNYPIISAGSNTGGEKNVTLIESQLPPHNHTITKSTSDVDGNTFSPGSGTGGVVTSSTTGGGQSHNNMQPYIVTLFIQRVVVV